MFLAIASVGAWINLFNLMPVWTLDGGRAFHAMSRGQRWIAFAATAASYAFVHDGLLLILLIVIAGRALAEPGNPEGDRRATAWYAALVVTLSVLCIKRATL